MGNLKENSYLIKLVQATIYKLEITDFEVLWSSSWSSLQPSLVDNCQLDTVAYFCGVRSECLELTSVNISWCHLVNDDGIEVLVENCTKLTEIICRGCTEVGTFFLNSFSHAVSK